MIKNNNYVNIQGWMCNDREKGGLGLKGNDLFIYAIIYGFAQTDGQCFCGSLNYLQEWTRSTRAGVIKNLNNLLDMGLIVKVESKPTNKYYIVPLNYVVAPEENLVNNVNSVENNVNLVNDSVNKVEEDSILSKHNNINNNNKNIVNNYMAKIEFLETVEDIISHFNSICSTNFKSTTANTRKLIKARLGEGFTVDDFKKVIECKYQDWGESPVRFTNGQISSDYLRPATLFSDKFENYLHEAKSREVKEVSNPYNSVSKEVDTDVSDIVF